MECDISVCCNYKCTNNIDNGTYIRVARNKNDEWPKFLLKSGQMMKKVAKNIYKNGQKMAKQFIFSFV